MSKIEFEQISENEIEVVIPPETPMEMVQTLTKSFVARGLIEDLKKSTLSVRYFYRTDDKINHLADKLIKSLEGMAKADDLPYWHPKAQRQHQKQQREAALIKPVAAPAPEQPATPISHAAPGARMADSTPAAMNTAGGTGRRYAYIGDTNKAEEHPSTCTCGKCELEKSNYGPKGAKLYNPADNARRKANNVEPVIQGPNSNAKAFSTKPGQLSAKASADLTARIQRQASKKQPVKQWTPEEIEAENKKRGLKKAWGQHLPFPSAEEEIMNLAKGEELQNDEDAAANQLAHLMVGKNMLGDNVPAGIKAMFAPPPPQPTNEQLFGGGVVTEEMAKSAERQWNNTFNNWLSEASKPISQRFASEEEELAYWKNLKVADRDDGQSGY